MNRQEAIDFIHQTAQHLERLGEHNPAKVLEIALETILPTPDPDTGLLPCGCGGEAKVWPSDLRQAMVTAYQVGCIKCAMTTVWVRGKQENAMKVWNTAMGWKGGAE